MPASPEQLHSALSYCMDFARTMLEDSGEFYPFGAKVSATGQLIAVGQRIEGQEHPQMQEVYLILMENMRSEIADGRAVATAVAANVNIPDQYSSPHRDGLRVTLEAAGYSRFIYVPYRLVQGDTLERKRSVEFAEPFAVEL